MKKLMLVAILCVAGYALAPIASASAQFEGSCQINGKAEFSSPLPKGFGPNAKLKYTFNATGAKGKCTETTPGQAAYKIEEATVKGEGEFSCLGAASFPNEEEEEGYGKIKVKNEKTGEEKETGFEMDLNETKLGNVVVHIEERDSSGEEKTAATTDALPDSPLEVESSEEAKGTANFLSSQNQPATFCNPGEPALNELEFQAAITGSLAP